MNSIPAKTRISRINQAIEQTQRTIDRLTLKEMNCPVELQCQNNLNTIEQYKSGVINLRKMIADIEAE